MATVQVSGRVDGQIVVGNNNVVISRAAGSSVTPLAGAPPVVSLRSGIGRPPLRERPPLVGREAEVEAVLRHVAARTPVEVVGGEGMGKSVVLYEVLRRHEGDAILLSGAGVELDDLLQQVFEACYESTAYRPDRWALRRLLGRVKVLVVVDDFAGSAEDARVLLDALPAADVVLSGPQRRLVGDGQAVEVLGLTRVATMALVARHLGRALGPGEEQAAGELWSAGRGHPRAVIQATIAARLRSSPGAAVTSFPPGSELAAAVARLLSPGAQGALRALVGLGGLPLTYDVLTAISGGTAERGVLDELHHAGLSTEEGGAWRAAGPWAGEVAAHVGGPFDIATFAPALTLWANTAPPRQVGRNADVIVRVLEAATAAGRHTDVLALARAAAAPVALSLRWGPWRRVLGLGEASARACGAADEAYFLHEQGVRLASTGQRAAAGAAFGAAAVVALRHGDRALAALSGRLEGQATGTRHATASGSRSAGRSVARLVVHHPALVAALAAATIALGTSAALAWERRDAPTPATVAASDPATATSSVSTRPTTTRPPIATTSEPPDTSPTTTRRPTQDDSTATTPAPLTDTTLDTTLDTTTGTAPAPTTHATELIGNWQSDIGDRLSIPEIDPDPNPTTGQAPVQIDLANGVSCSGSIGYTDLGDTIAYSMYVDCTGDSPTASAELDITDDSMVMSCTLALYDAGCPTFNRIQPAGGGG